MGAGVELDILIPVYNEGANILPTLEALEREVKTPYRVLICYDRDDDDTLPAVASRQWKNPVVNVKNERRGAHGAIVTGFEASTAPAVMVIPADDDYTAPRVDGMVEAFRKGSDIVCASRFVAGGRMVGCPWLKATLVRSSAFTLHWIARLPTRDASNGLRLFSRRVIDTIAIESTVGFTYSIELLVKAHRLGWTITDVPAEWFERKAGKSRFAVIKWLPAYLTWYRYAFATTYLFRGPATVPRTVPARSAS